MNTALYERCNSKNGECYAQIHAIGNKEDMELLKKAYRKKGTDVEITPIKKIGSLKLVSKKTITESKLRELLNGEDPSL
jgi:hypothetical protein